MSNGQGYPRFAGVEIRVECGRCVQSVPINGPIRSLRCPFCGEPIAITEDHVAGPVKHAHSYYKEVREGVPENAVNLDHHGYYRFVYVRERPRCHACRKKLDVDSVDEGADGEITCSCGATTSTFPAPGWVRAVSPQATQLYGAERPGEEPSGREATARCPRCGADMPLTQETRRVHRCEYCETDVFISAEAWTSLHPVPVPRRWYVRYDKA